MSAPHQDVNLQRRATDDWPLASSRFGHGRSYLGAHGDVGGRFKKPGQQGGDAAHVMSAIRVEQGEVRIPVAEHGGTLEGTRFMSVLNAGLSGNQLTSSEIPLAHQQMQEGIFLAGEGKRTC
ncbi:MAG TPA: hypothetical protein VH164_12525, partial [Ktedonobacteraceae bacterium]|nr:hypothetical protein [Ktedonobacteraceae bacterium]